MRSIRQIHPGIFMQMDTRGDRPPEEQKQLSKEFVRQWLISKGFQGKEGQTVPSMSDAFVKEVSERYIELYESITGEKFEKADTSRIEERILKNINDFISK